MLIDQKKRRGKTPVTALCEGLDDDSPRQGHRPGTIWKQRKLLNDLIGWLQVVEQLAMGDFSMAQVDRLMAKLTITALWLSACAGRDGALARFGRADGLAPPTCRVAQGA